MPDCEQYKQLYQEFSSLKERFSEKMEKFREEGIIDKEMEELKSQLKEKQKEIRPLLEKYFLKFEFSDNIEGFGNRIVTSQPLSDQEVLVGGDDGELRILNIKTKQFSDNIEGFGNHIKTSQPL